MNSSRTKGKASDVDAYIGKRILQFRQFSRMSQETLADRLGITFQQIQKYEKGSNRVAASRLYEFSKIFGVGMDDFITGYETLPKNRTSIIDSIPPELSKVIEMLSEIPNERARTSAIKNMILVLKILQNKQDATNSK